MKTFREFILEVNRPENGSDEEKRRWDKVKVSLDSKDSPSDYIIGTTGRDKNGVQTYGLKKKSSRTGQQINRASRLTDVDSDLDPNQKQRGDKKANIIKGRGKEHHHLTPISQSAKEFKGLTPEQRREKREKDAKGGKFHGSDPRNLAQTDGPSGGRGIPHRGKGGYHSGQKPVGKGGSIQDFGSEAEILAVRRRREMQAARKRSLGLEGKELTKNFKTFIDESISFRINTELNPKFWSGNKLKPEVLGHLKKVADAWTKFVGLKKSDVKDILLLGGNAGYNYTKFSDLDLHIVVDLKSTVDCPDLSSEYYEDKKQLWKLTHNAKIYGHDIEPYVEDIGKKRRKDQGVYSIKFRKWMIIPGKFTGEVDRDLLEKKVRDMMVKIDRTVGSATNEDVLEALLSKLRDMRNAGLDKSGEFSFENLVFKELRNRGYIDKLADHILKLQDKSLTLENYVS